MIKANDYTKENSEYICSMIKDSICPMQKITIGLFLLQFKDNFICDVSITQCYKRILFI